MQIISSYLPTSVIGRWILGASLFPVEFALRELCLSIAKSSNLCSETMVEYYKRNFQKIETVENRFCLVQSSKTARFVVEKCLNLFQASNVALIEETLCRFGLQYGVFTYLPSLFYENGSEALASNSLIPLVRVVATAIIFGLLHCQGAEIRNTSAANKLTSEQVKKERNFEVIGAFASGLVYSTVYEVANQSLWASYGCHTMWDFMHDVIVSKTWKLEPAGSKNYVGEKTVGAKRRRGKTRNYKPKAS